MTDPLKEKKDKIQKKVHQMLMSLNAVGKGRPDEIERYYENNMKYGVMMDAVRAAGFRDTRDLLESNSFPDPPGVRLFKYNGSYYEAVLYNQALKDQYENVVSQSKNKVIKEAKNREKYGGGKTGSVRGVRGGIRGVGTFGVAFRVSNRGRGGGASASSSRGGYSGSNVGGGSSFIGSNSNNNGGFGSESSGLFSRFDGTDRNGGFNNGGGGSFNSGANDNYREDRDGGGGYRRDDNYDDGYSNNGNGFGSGGRNEQDHYRDDRSDWQRDRGNDDYIGTSNGYGRDGGRSGGYDMDSGSYNGYGRNDREPSPARYRQGSSPPGIRRNDGGGGGGLFGDREPTPTDGYSNRNGYEGGGYSPTKSAFDRPGIRPPGLGPTGPPPGFGHDDDEYAAPRRSVFLRQADLTADSDSSASTIRPAVSSVACLPPGLAPPHPPGLGPDPANSVPPGFPAARTLSESDIPSTSAFKPVKPPQVRGIELPDLSASTNPPPGVAAPANPPDAQKNKIQMREIVGVLALHLARFQPVEEKEMPAEKLVEVVRRFFGFDISSAIRKQPGGMKQMCDKIRMKDTDKFITLHSYNNHTKQTFSLRSIDDVPRIIDRFGYLEDMLLEREKEAKQPEPEPEPTPETPILVKLRKTLADSRSEETPDAKSVERMELLLRMYELYLREKLTELTIAEVVERLQLKEANGLKPKAQVYTAYQSTENEIFDGSNVLNREGMGILSLKPHAMVNYVEPKVAPPRVSSLVLPAGLREAMKCSRPLAKEFRLDSSFPESPPTFSGTATPSSHRSSPSSERPKSRSRPNSRKSPHTETRNLPRGRGDVHGFAASEIRRDRIVSVPNTYYRPASGGGTSGQYQPDSTSAAAENKPNNANSDDVRQRQQQQPSPFIPIDPAVPAATASRSEQPTTFGDVTRGLTSPAVASKSLDNSPRTPDRGSGQQQSQESFGSRGKNVASERSPLPRTPPTPDGSPPDRFSAPAPDGTRRNPFGTSFGGASSGSSGPSSSNDFSTSRPTTTTSESSAGFRPTSSSVFASGGTSSSAAYTTNRNTPQSEFAPFRDDRPSWQDSSPDPSSNFRNPGRDDDQGYGRDDGYGSHRQGPPPGMGFDNEPRYRSPQQQQQQPPPPRRDDDRYDDSYARHNDDWEIPREPLQPVPYDAQRHELFRSYHRRDRHKVQLTMHYDLNLFYVRLLEDEDRYRRMQRDLTDLYAEADRDGRLPRCVYLQSGDRMALFDHSKWHRVEIESCSRDTSGQRTTLRFLDTGEAMTAVFKPRDLVPLAARFARMPPFALCCSVEKFVTMPGKRSELREREQSVFKMLLEAEPGQVELVALDAFNGDKMMEVQLEYYFRGGMEHVPDFFVELGLIRLDRQSRGPQPQQHGYAPRGGPPGL